MKVIRFCTLALVFFLSFSSCKKKTVEYPFIPKEDLIEFLTDMYITEGILMTTPKGRSNMSREEDSTLFYQSLFLKHGFTKQAFDSTIIYLSDYPTELSAVQEKVLEILIEKEGAIRDSVKNNSKNID